MDLGLIIGSSGLLGILILIFRMGKFNGIINSKFDAIDKRLDGIESEIKDLRQPHTDQ